MSVLQKFNPFNQAIQRVPFFEHLLWIDIRRGFVKDQYSVPPQNGSREAEKLALTDAEVASSGHHGCLERQWAGCDVLQLDILQSAPNFVVIVLFEWVQVAVTEDNFNFRGYNPMISL